MGRIEAEVQSYKRTLRTTNHANREKAEMVFVSQRSIFTTETYPTQLTERRKAAVGNKIQLSARRQSAGQAALNRWVVWSEQTKFGQAVLDLVQGLRVTDLLHGEVPKFKINSPD